MRRKCTWVVTLAAVMVCLMNVTQGQTVHVNFQSRTEGDGSVPEGYLPDYGDVFGDRGNGYSYGWDRNITGDSRDRDNAASLDQRYDTCNHLQKASPPAVWEIALENGVYNIFLVCGEPSNTDQTNTMNVEGVILIDPDGQDNYDEYELAVEVTDGRLTITASAADGASNAKITFVDIVLAIAPEAARSPSPAKEAVDVPRDLVVAWEPGQGVSAHDVYLGTSLEDVNSASRNNPMGVLISQGRSPASLDVSRLEFSQTYYWRIDEVLTAGGIYKGEVWSFTVEPYAYAVKNIVASTNVTSDPGMGIDNTINGSGLNGVDQHSTDSSAMWLGKQTDGATIWIEYAFDQVYKLDEMLVWNYNVQFEPVLGFGLKDVAVEYSADGQAWASLGDIEFAQATATADYTANTIVDFGGEPVQYVRLTVLSNFKGLTQYGLGEVRFMYIPAAAREPEPAQEATEVSVDSVLTWRAGREAAVHEVYFGTDDDDLALVDTVDAASFVPDVLNFGTTYYWTVTEVNEVEAISAWEGGLWSFATQEYAVIDDFEAYDDEENRIYDTWLDGWVNETGSTVGYLEAPFAEQTVVNSGSQSMPLEYDNSASPFYSETERDLAGWNLTANGAETLRLYFRGNPVAFQEQADGTIVVGGGGADIWNTADEFRYAYKQLSGDGEIIARVDSIVNTDGWAKVGVMMRESLQAGAAFAAIYITPGNGCRYQARLATTVAAVSDSDVATAEQTAITAPYWVKLVRSGNEYSGYYSGDGVTWTAMVWNPRSIAMGNSVYIGLAVTSHNTSAPTTAKFSGVATTGGVTGSWQTAEIGVAQPANDPDSLYVALEDSSGRTTVITHPDPAATTIGNWTEWSIPLSDLDGINASSIRTMYIGTGDRDNPAAGGAGIMYIDDVQFGRTAPEPMPEPTYLYDGEALDDTWDHDNGSDAWDDLPIGQGMPGGVSALVEDDVTFLRIQDPGDPRDYDGRSDPTNRKIYLTHLTDAGLDGAHLEFAIRLATSAPLDDMYPDGGAGVEPWPAEGIAYHVRDGGKGMISLAEAGLGVISFSLARGGQAGLEDVTGDVLVMNNLVGDTPSGDVDTEDTAGTIVAKNWIAIDDITQWNTIAVDIVAGGAGTHQVTVSVNGGEAQTFDVTAGDGLEGDGSYIAMGSSGTGGITAFDVDYIAYVVPE